MVKRKDGIQRCGSCVLVAAITRQKTKPWSLAAPSQSSPPGTLLEPAGGPKRNCSSECLIKQNIYSPENWKDSCRHTLWLLPVTGLEI